MTRAVRWTEIEDLFNEAGPFLPETGGILPLLLRKLRAVEHLEGAESRLLGLDLDNLVESIRRITVLRREGVDTPGLKKASVHVMMLARDMKEKAEGLLAAETRDIEIHASVAAMDATGKSESRDQTHAFRLIAAAPAPRDDDRPGRIVDTPIPIDEGQFGRISGKGFQTVIDRRQGSQAAPIGAAALPAGHVARFEEGEAFILYNQGVRAGDRFRVPRPVDCQGTLVEAGEGGITIHGPAVIAPARTPGGILKKLADERAHLDRYLSATLNASSKVHQFACKTHFRSPMLAFISVAMAGLGLFSPRITDLESAIMFIAAFLLALGAAVLLLLEFRNKKEHRKALRGLLEDIGNEEPSSLHSGELASNIRSIWKDMIKIGNKNCFKKKALPGFEEIHILDIRSDVHGILKTIKFFDGLNAFPARRMETDEGDSPLVMKALPALPSPENVIAMEKARVALKA